MKTNKEKFLDLVSEEDSSTMNEVRNRIKNREMLRESQRIAIKVLVKLDELNWTQKDLAFKMNVSAQQINKIVRGKQNLTLDTIVKLQNLLNIVILSNSEASKFEFVETNTFTTIAVNQFANHRTAPNYNFGQSLVLKTIKPQDKPFTYLEAAIA